jgi:hypothetical protein
MDCGLLYDHFDNHMLILKEPVWLSIANKEDVLCDKCISKRLNREVVISDLWKNEWGQMTPINEWYIKKLKQL